MTAQGSAPRTSCPTLPERSTSTKDCCSWGPARNGSFAEDVSAYEYWVRGHTLHVGTAWFAGTPDDLTAYAGWDLAQPRCPPGAWPATYTWSNEQGRRTGRFQGENTYAPYLVLTAERDPCAARRRLLEGTWEGLGT